MIGHAASLMLEGDTDPREILLAQLSMARLTERHAADLQRRYARQAQELRATDRQLAYATGLREQTIAKKYPKSDQDNPPTVAPADDAVSFRKRSRRHARS